MGIDNDFACKLCQNSTEAINHVLFKCSIDQQLWKITKVPSHGPGFSSIFEDNLSYNLDLMDDFGLNEKIRTTIPRILWNIWKNQNSIIYAHKQMALSRVVQQTFEEATMWQEVNINTNVRSSNIAMNPDRAHRWTPPLQGSLKCNLNSTWCSASLHSGGAWIIRDHTGNVRFHAREAFTHSPNRFVAELRCIIWTLQSPRDLRIRDVVIGLDCQSVIEALHSPMKWSRHQLLWTHISMLRQYFDSCSFEEESIGANAIARAISQSVLRNGRFNSYLVLRGPAWLQNQIARETRN